MSRMYGSKFTRLFLGVLLVFAFSFPATISALTTQERTSLILQLVQKILEINTKIVALGGAPIIIPLRLATLVQGQASGGNTPDVSASCTISRTLALGSRGEEVTCLQRFLISQNLLAPDSATGYFGPLTRVAVIALQQSRGLEPVGHVGKLTRVIVNAASVPHTPSTPASQPPITPPVSGGGGSVPLAPPVPPSPTCTPLPAQTQTLACPAGQTGSITQTRTSVCATGATSPVWNEWQTSANTCATIPPPPPPHPALRLVSVSNVAAVTISKPADLPAYTESPPWIIAGGWHGYFISTDHAYFCASPDGLIGAGITLQSRYCTLVTNATTSRDWERSYGGVMSAYALRPNTPDALIIEAIHGENVNEIKNGVSVQNTINTDVLVSNCADRYDAQGVFQNCWEAYNGFVNMAHMPFTEAAGWGLSAPVSDDGPIVWPASGYLHADGTKASQGVRHPSFFVFDGYLYVYYIDMSYGSTWGSVKVARAALPDLPSPSAFRAYGNGGFSQPALPAGFDTAAIRSFYRTKGPASDCVVECNNDPFRFSVSSVKGSDRFLGVLEYWDKTDKKAKVSLMTSSDLVHWSDPVVIQQADTWADITLHYPVFMDDVGWTNTLVDPKSFYIVGTDTHAHTMTSKVSVEIVE